MQGPGLCDRRRRGTGLGGAIACLLAVPPDIGRQTARVRGRDRPGSTGLPDLRHVAEAPVKGQCPNRGSILPAGCQVQASPLALAAKVAVALAVSAHQYAAPDR